MAEQHGVLTAGLVDEPIEVTHPVKIQDLTFRDGHQSLFATRGRTEDFIPIAEEMDQVGFYSMEVWGGATFDTMHRFLGEDPWERIRTLKKYIKNTPFSMLLRGQNLVGYRNYPDDVAEAFVERACENGMDIFRVFDALNDFRNFETAVKVIKKCGKHFQGAICYSLTEPRMGGEVYNLDYYVQKAKQLEDMGADTICIKDMAGLIAPYDAYILIKTLKENVKVPIHLHSHFTSGMADMSLLKAIEAGVDIVDTCLSPWAYRTSHPAVEPLVVTLRGTNRDTGLDIKQLAKCSEYMEKISPKYRHLLDNRMSIIDTNVLLHQTPGGMLSNLVNQLREMDALDKLDEVFKQLPIVRRELGQVPLVTPTSQIVGIQTVNNVLFDTPEERYKMITAQVKDMCYGLYGKTPVPIDPEVQKKALKGYPRGETPITVRPADVLEPELEKAKKEVEGLAKDLDDVLIYALYPTTGKRFLRWKYGHEPMPDEVKPKTLEDVQAEEELVKKAKAGLLVEKPQKEAPPKGPGVCTFNVFVDGEYFEVDVEQVGGVPVVSQITPVAPSAPQPTAPQPAPAQPVVPPPPPKPAAPAAQPAAAPPPPKPAAPAVAGGTPMEAPMPGMVIRYEVKEGDTVNEGDVVLILEAMKMENSITAPVSGTVVKVHFKDGDSVQKGDVLAVIG
ncbi:pyruvate carboxylase subunit B [Desulfacinum hydrothermale DSM 13146]|uniref:Pyruvate carboxylase subunit B n=1 Tax=Desulfacinum hydrothermale DSM 13146 TaxID=1121390 RepID=A0A1W1X1E4_9BACT|nr:pyruvate carboxylase subunit B [Desulfacinum hydrothermale]SMC17548.1 pyruvate carboxylase subunit B [Desulfacinum hydrothermale DSM 13146]